MYELLCYWVWGTEACVGLDGCSELLLYAIQISTLIYGTSGITCVRLETKVCLVPEADIALRNDWCAKTRIRRHPRSETWFCLWRSTWSAGFDTNQISVIWTREYGSLCRTRQQNKRYKARIRRIYRIKRGMLRSEADLGRSLPRDYATVLPSAVWNPLKFVKVCHGTFPSSWISAIGLLKRAFNGSTSNTRGLLG